ncbi:MAG: hypothetical protein QM504_10310 [Pseudomonadota bacterium]
MPKQPSTPIITPADIILQQMGGRGRLCSMLGAKDFYSDNDGKTLVFKFTARAKNGINYIRITVNKMDTYDVEFVKVGRKKDKELGFFMPVRTVVSNFKGLYVDNLHDIFESETGLDLTIGKVIVKKRVAQNG